MRPLIEDMLRQSAATPSDGDILDLGCGAGQLASRLAALASKVTAIACGRQVAGERALHI